MNTSAHSTHSLDELIGRQLPAWMAKATPEQLAGLRTAMQAAAASHARVQQLLGALESPQAFAEARLSAALQRAAGAPVDVRRHRLIRTWHTVESLPMGTLPGRSRTHRLEQSLLEAALHNFDQSEAVAGGAAGSLTLLDNSNRIMALAPERFVQICRELDLGGHYQAYLDSRFEPSEAQARSNLHALLEQLQREDLLVALQRARITGDIGAQDYRHVLQIVAAKPLVPSDDKQVRCRQLRVLGRPLNGVVLFEVRGSTALVEAVIAYLPGDAQAPLKSHASWAALYQDLGGRFRDPQFVTQVQGYVGAREGRVFAANLARQLAAAGSAAVIALDGRDSAFEGPLLATLYRQRIALLKDNARLLAVPTGDENFAARAKRVQAYQSAGINLLNLASLFVPGLGELMLGVAVLQIVSEVYHGFEDWQQGDREGAINHMLGVAENLAAMTVMAAGGSATLSLLRRSGFVDALVPVQLAPRRARLMSADLSSYRLADSSVVVGQLAQRDTRALLRLHDGTYALGRDESRGAWRIRHPCRAEAYTPLLEHNGAGGWQHPLDPPHFWQGAGPLVQRLGSETSAVSEEMAQRLISVTGFDEARLRRLHLEGRPAPGRLLEALQRFELDAQFSELIRGMAQEQPLPVSLLRLQLDLATALPGWPRSIGLRVTLPDGGEWIIAAPAAEVSQTLQLPADRLSTSAWPEVLLDGLPEHVASSWLEQPRALPEVNRQQLQRLISRESLGRRAALFEHAWRQRQVSELTQVTLLRRDFAGLGVAVARELLEQTPSAQVARLLLRQRIPLEVGERARWSLRESRLDHANAGFHQLGMANADTETLALRLIDELAPWPADLRVELRQVGAEAGLLCAVGSARAARTVRVLKTSRGYRLDGAEAIDAGDLFQVLAPLLDESQRTVLALGDASGEHLRRALGNRAAADRPRAARLLGQAPSGFRPPQRLGDGRLGYTLSGRGNPERSAINRALRELYPTFTDEQASDYLNEVRASGQNIWTHVFDRQQQLAKLDTALNAWTAEPRTSDPRMAVGRRRAAWLIRNCWRRRALLLSGRDAGYRLRIDEEPLGTLPTLHESVDFSHVSDLTLRSLELSTINRAFLARFTGLRWLSLSENRLTEIPPALTHLPRLRHLELDNNQIAVDDAGNSALAALPCLEVLYLEHNPLGPQLDLTPMTHLQVVGLRATQLVALPRGLLSRSGLIAADLRSNRLETLPDDAFSARSEVLSRLDLHENPLMPATRARLVDIDHASGVGTARAVPEGGPAAQARRIWLSRAEGEIEGRLTREARWARLEAEPASDDFFQLLADLANTADFEVRRSDLERRMWAVVEACEQSTRVRRELFELASRPRTCGDSVALHFSFLEVRVLVLSATQDLSAAMVEPALLRLGRSLFRLDEVDRIAAQDIAQRQAQGVLFDEIEVRLAYRVGLAKPLGLPGQPLDMRFEQLANVDSRQLLQARGRVLTAEQTPRMVQTLAEREFWVEHLLATRAQEFERSDQAFFERLDALTARQQAMTDAEYLHQANAIGAERALARQGLIDRLTLAAWQRFTGSGDRAGE